MKAVGAEEVAAICCHDVVASGASSAQVQSHSVEDETRFIVGRITQRFLEALRKVSGRAESCADTLGPTGKSFEAGASNSSTMQLAPISKLNLPVRGQGRYPPATAGRGHGRRRSNGTRKASAAPPSASGKETAAVKERSVPVKTMPDGVACTWTQRSSGRVALVRPSLASPGRAGLRSFEWDFDHVDGCWWLEEAAQSLDGRRADMGELGPAGEPSRHRLENPDGPGAQSANPRWVPLTHCRGTSTDCGCTPPK